MLDDQPERLTGDEPDFLSEGERLRLAGFRFEKRRSEWLLGRWTAKQLLRRSLAAAGQPMNGMAQVFNLESGQPYFIGPGGEGMAGCLSISHRAGRAFCAWSPAPGLRLGADLEIWEPRDPIFIEDYLTAKERETALACSGKVRDLVVTLAWSTKESIFKGLGTGLRMDTRSVEVAGLENLANGAELPHGWQPMTCTGAAIQDRMRGWWRVDGELILTLCELGVEEIELVELSAG